MIANMIKVNYSCPRCMYATSRKSRIVDHFNRKKPCPLVSDEIELTDDIKKMIIAGSTIQKVQLPTSDQNNTNSSNTICHNITVENPDQADIIFRRIQDECEMKAFKSALEQSFKKSYLTLIDAGHLDKWLPKLAALQRDAERCRRMHECADNK